MVTMGILPYQGKLPVAERYISRDICVTYMNTVEFNL
jgi:hypothetical protein